MTLPFLTGNRTLLSGTKRHSYGTCTCETDYLEYTEKKCMLFLSNNLIKKLYYFLFIDIFQKKSDFISKPITYLKCFSLVVNGAMKE